MAIRMPAVPVGLIGMGIGARVIAGRLPRRSATSRAPRRVTRSTATSRPPRATPAINTLTAAQLFQLEKQKRLSTRAVAAELTRRKRRGQAVVAGKLTRVRAGVGPGAFEPKRIRGRAPTPDQAKTRSVRQADLRRRVSPERAKAELERRRTRTQAPTARAERRATEPRPQTRAAARAPVQEPARRQRVFGRFRQTEATRLQEILDRKKRKRAAPTPPTAPKTPETRAKRVPGSPVGPKVEPIQPVKPPVRPGAPDAVRVAAEGRLRAKGITIGRQVDLAQALERGGSRNDLVVVGFKGADIDRAAKRNIATRVLRDRGFIDARGAVDTNRALAEGVKARVLLDAGFTAGQLARSKIDARVAREKSKPRDLVAEIRDKNVQPRALLREGFSREDVKRAQLKIFADRQLKKFESEGGVDIDSALQRGVPLSTLRQAGFAPEDITQAQIAKRVFDKGNTTTGLLKRAGVKVAEAVVPGVWVKDWNKFSNKERALNIAFDAMFIIPVAGAAARSARGLTKAVSLTKGQRATKGALGRLRQSATDGVQARPGRRMTTGLSRGVDPSGTSEVGRVVARIDRETAIRANLSRVESQKAKLTESFDELNRAKSLADLPRKQQQEAAIRAKLNRIESDHAKLSEGLKSAAESARSANRGIQNEARRHIAARNAAKAAGTDTRALARRLSPEAEQVVKDLDAATNRGLRLNQLNKDRQATKELLDQAGKDTATRTRKIGQEARQFITARDAGKATGEISDAVARQVKVFDRKAAVTANLNRVEVQRKRLSDSLKDAAKAGKGETAVEFRQAKEFIGSRATGASASALPKRVQKIVASLDREKAIQARLNDLNKSRAATEELLKGTTRTRAVGASQARQEALDFIRARKAGTATKDLSAAAKNEVGRIDREASIRLSLKFSGERRDAVVRLLQKAKAAGRTEDAKNLRAARQFIAERNAILAPVSGISQRAGDAQIIKGADAIAQAVKQSGSSRQVIDARDAALELGLALQRKNAAAAALAARKLTAIGKATGLTPLVDRMRPLLTETGARKAIVGLDAAGRFALKEGRRSVDDINRQLFKIDDASDLRKASDKAVADKKRLEEDIKRTEALRKKTKSPERKQKLSERIERTKTQVKEREKTVGLSFEKPLFPPVVGPVPARVKTTALVRKGKTTTALVRRKEAAKAARLPTKKQRAAVSKRIGTKVIPRVVAKGRPRTAVFVAPRATAETVLVSAVATGTVLAPKVLPKTRISPLVKPSPATQPQPARVPKPSPTAVPKPSPVADPKPAPAPKATPTPTGKPVPKPTPTTKPVLRRPPASRPVKTTVKPPPGRKITRKFRLPGRDGAPKLRPGTFPRIVTWRQGFVRIKLDIDTGEKKFTRTKEETPLTPAQSFRVVTTDRTRPKPQSFRQGVVRIDVRPNSISFKGLKRRKSSRSIG